MSLGRGQFEGFEKSHFSKTSAGNLKHQTFSLFLFPFLSLSPTHTHTHKHEFSFSLSFCLTHKHTHTLLVAFSPYFSFSYVRVIKQWLQNNPRFLKSLFSNRDQFMNITNSWHWLWWWSSGQGPCLLLRQSKFESYWLLKYFSVWKKAGIGPSI